MEVGQKNALFSAQSTQWKRNSDSKDERNASKKEALEKSKPLPVFGKTRLVSTSNSFVPFGAVPMEDVEFK
jgi:hypothetical protein